MPSSRRLRSSALAVLAIFAATNAAPRPGLYAHHHAGGGHVHVHPWGEDVFGHDDHDEDDHDHAHAVADGRPGLEEPDGDHPTHVHWQAPFEQTTRPEAARLVRTTFAHRLFASPTLPAGVETVARAFARGPPPDTAS